MSKTLDTKENKQLLKTAQMVFMVDFANNQQNISLVEGVAVQDLLNVPFRVALHLNQLIEESVNAGQAREAVGENTQAENK